MPTSRPLPILRPDRMRQIPPSFAWLDHRLRSHGFLERLTAPEISLYFFLALAADASGRSCWRVDRIERQVPFDAGQLRRAREGLVRTDLLAFRPWRPQEHDGAYQLLSLPEKIDPKPCPAGADPLPLGKVLAELNWKKR